MTDMTDEIQADEVLDCVGLLCPMPVVRASQAIKNVEVGQVLKMVADDPGSPPDMVAWAKQTGNELLAQHSEGGRFEFWFRRTK